MKADIVIPQKIDQAHIRLNYYPINDSKIGAAGGKEQISNRSKHTRICPYCENAIPTVEDPCHICGHLEPADVVEVSDPSAISTSFYYKLMIAFFFVSGVAMMIWPDSNPMGNYECDPFNADDCMLPFLIWSRPGGIFLVLLASMFMVKDEICKHWKKKI